MIKQIDKDLWKIKENDFEAVVDVKWLLLYLNYYTLIELKYDWNIQKNQKSNR